MKIALGNTQLIPEQNRIECWIKTMQNRGHQINIFSFDSKLILDLDLDLDLDLVIVGSSPVDLFVLKSSINKSTIEYGLWIYYGVNHPLAKLFEDDKTLDLVDIFIFVSNYQRESWINKYNINKNKTLVLPYGITHDEESYSHIGLTKIPNSLTGSSTIEPIYQQIKSHNPSITLINNHMDQTDRIEQNIFTSDIFLIPDIIPHQSYPLVLSAMCAGCLIVSSDLGVLPELTSGLNSQIKINPDDNITDQFVTAVIEIMSLSKQIKTSMREQNKKWVQQNYTYKVLCENFEKDIGVIIKMFANNKNELLLEQFNKEFNNGNWSQTIMIGSQITKWVNQTSYWAQMLNMGVAFYNMGMFEKSIHHLSIAKSICSDYNVNKNIALVSLYAKKPTKFIKHARNALDIKFDIGLGRILAEKYYKLGMFHEAIGLYSSIISIDPTNIPCLNNLANIYLFYASSSPKYNEQCLHTYELALSIVMKLALSNVMKLADQIQTHNLIIGNILFAQLYNWEITNTDIFNKSVELASKLKSDIDFNNGFKHDSGLISINKSVELASKLKSDIDFNNGFKHDSGLISINKIRIGYISSDFISHPVGHVFNNILGNHSTDRFEIFIYDNSNQQIASDDIISLKLKSYSNINWRILEQKSDMDSLDIIKNDSLDILVEMMGHTRNNRLILLELAKKFIIRCPIIVSYFAYPATTGLRTIDYKLTDQYASPESTQKYFTEKFYYLPNGIQTWTPIIPLSDKKDYYRDKYSIHLACFNNPTKLSFPTIQVFSQVLKELPEAKLFLRYNSYKSSHLTAHITNQFINLGIEESRIDIGHLDWVSGLKLYNQMDIALDPFPYGGGIVSSEALYMGTPIVTLSGTNYPGRVGTSLLSNLKLFELIATDIESYVRIVVNLARDQSRLRELHSTLRIRMESTDLANGSQFTLHLEQAYENLIKIKKIEKTIVYK
jgi:predicted O-linked N-acetylglucosamine transferase (SPINDLY family)